MNGIHLARHHGHAPVQFKDDDFQFGFEIALGASYHRCADVGEVLQTAARVKDGDADAWLAEWEATGDAVWAMAEAADAAGHRVSALAHYRRAATYYATALYTIARSKSGDRLLELWRRQHDCWERVVDRMPVPGERVAIPYEGTAMPGWLFRAPDAQPGEPRPLVVMNNGSDGATSMLYVSGGAAASERGWHWLAFDGPGQQSMLFEQNIPFRHDWEAVLTPVLDAMTARDDVDAERIALIGISQAGYWVPRALAFEHRFAAAVADPGVVDVSTAWLDPLPGSMRKELEEGKREQFDRNMRIGEKLSHAARSAMEFRGRPYGIAGDSRYDLFAEVLKNRLGEEVAQIDTPLLITEPEGEQFWPGQSRQLYDRLPGEKQLVRFTAAEGGGRHCEPTAASLRDTRVFDWLEERLG
jgi:hypothetical protein